MHLPLTGYVLLSCLALLATLDAATVRASDSQGVTISFLNPYVGSFHLSCLYPTDTSITADTTINDVITTMAALVDNVVPPSVFLVYSDPAHSRQLQPDTPLDDTTVLYVDVVHPDLTVVEGLSVRKERRLLELVERIDAAIDAAVHRGQQQLAEGAKKAEQLAEEAAAQATLVHLLEARVSGLDQLLTGDGQSSAKAALQRAADAVAIAAVLADAQVRLTSDLQSDIAEVQGLLDRILLEVAKVAAIVEQAEVDLRHRHGRHERHDSEAADEQTELAEATLIVHDLTEVLELGVKAVAEAHDILRDGEAAVAAAEAVAEAVEIAECAVNEAQKAVQRASTQYEQDKQGGSQGEGVDATESSTGNDGGKQEGADATIMNTSATSTMSATAAAFASNGSQS